MDLLKEDSASDSLRRAEVGDECLAVRRCAAITPYGAEFIVGWACGGRVNALRSGTSRGPRSMRPTPQFITDKALAEVTG